MSFVRKLSKQLNDAIIEDDDQSFDPALLSSHFAHVLSLGTNNVHVPNPFVVKGNDVACFDLVNEGNLPYYQIGNISCGTTVYTEGTNSLNTMEEVTVPRHVTFETAVVVHNVPHINDLTPTELFETWYTSHDYAGMKKHNQLTLKLFKNHRSLFDRNGGMALIDKEEYCVLGAQERRAQHHVARACVFQEQEYHRFYHDSECPAKRIAAVYRVFTMDSANTAREAAYNLEQELRIDRTLVGGTTRRNIKRINSLKNIGRLLQQIRN